MHAAVCLLRAGQQRSAGDAAKLGQFVGEFSWVTSDPIGVEGLITNLLLYYRKISPSLRKRLNALTVLYCNTSSLASFSKKNIDL